MPGKGFFFDLEVSFLSLLPNSPGRNPDFIFKLSMPGSSCGQTPFSRTEVSTSSKGGPAAMYLIKVEKRRSEQDKRYSNDRPNTGKYTKDVQDYV
jgi:hypothetical protein